MPAIGGAERTLLEWGDQLARRGHAVRTVCLPPAPRPGPERYWRWRASQREAVGRLVADAVAKRRPDVVIAQLHAGPAALAAAARAGVAGVLVVPSYEALCKLAFDAGSDCPPGGDCAACPAAACLSPPERAALVAGRAAHDAALAGAAALVTTSRATAEAARRWSGREATVVWPVGPELPAPAGARRDGPVVLAAARWAPHKGAGLLPALVDAAARAARPVHVTPAGLEPAQREAVLAAGGTLVAPAPIDQLVAGASLVLVPSQWEEPFGRVAWEALARGVPVLASAAGGLVECVPEELRVVRRDDPRAWAAAIDGLLSDPAAWRAAAAGARPHAARLLHPPPIDRLAALLHTVS